MFMNLKLPFGLGGNTENKFSSSLGMAEIWMKQYRSNSKEFAIGWTAGFESQAICIDYSFALSRIAVGLDSGVIALFDTKLLKPKQEPIFKESVHTMRVMGLKIDEDRKRVYSVGEDGFIRVVCLKTSHVYSEAFVSDSKLTNIRTNFSNKLAIITDRKGKVYFYDMFSVYISLVLGSSSRKNYSVNRIYRSY